jgi:hypothetical protein
MAATLRWQHRAAAPAASRSPRPKITDPKLLEDSYQWAVDAFVKDPRVPADAEKALVDQMVTLKMIEAAAAGKDSRDGVLR